MTDRDLVSGILHNEEASLRLLFDRYYQRILRYVKNKLADEKDAEEVTQDVFMASLESLRDFSFRCSLSTFLISIAKRKVIDRYRKKKLKRLLFSQFPQIESLIAILTTPEETLDETLLVEKIEKTFARLRPRYRTLLQLKYVEDRSVAQIAENWSMSFKSVESMLFRARKAFAAEFAQ